VCNDGHNGTPNLLGAKSRFSNEFEKPLKIPQEGLPGKCVLL